MNRPADWIVQGEATANIAIATRTGEVGHRHVVTAIAGGFEDVAQVGTLRLQRTTGNLNVAQFPVVGAGGIFHVNYRDTLGEQVRGILTAGGATIIGRVNIMGYTE